MCRFAMLKWCKDVRVCHAKSGAKMCRFAMLKWCKDVRVCHARSGAKMCWFAMLKVVQRHVGLPC